MRQWRRGLWLCLALGALGFVIMGTALLTEGRLASGSSTATVRIADGTVEPGESETTTLEALNVPAPGVCALIVDVTYDAAVKTATGCDADPQGLFDMPLCELTGPGAIRLTAIETATGATGSFPLADITWHGEGDPGECTLVDLDVKQFADCDGHEFTVTDHDGENCIVSPSSSPTPTPTPTPTPMPGPGGSTPTPTPPPTPTATPTPTPTPTPAPDDDGDGLPNNLDPCPNDDDCDDDGLVDGSASSEDLNDNGVVDPGETDPTNWDSDGDGLSDGLETGLTTPEGQDTDTTSPHWQPDADPTTKTDPLSADTNGDGVPDGEEDINANGSVDEGESDPSLVAASLAQGWSQTCYVGETKPIDQALATIIDKVLAVYMLKDGQTFDRWFPGSPGLSTITTLSPYDQVFVLTSGAVPWNQQFFSPSQGSAPLAPGWNSVCYTGTAKAPEDATLGIAEDFGILYMLGSDQDWSRYVPGRPEASNIAQLKRFDVVLLLLTKPGGSTWTFDP